MADHDERRDPIEQALEYMVYLPLGIALEVPSLVPRFIDRGRNQVVLARVIGKYAVTKGNAAAEGVAVRATEQAGALLRVFGLAPDEAHTNHGDLRTAPPASPSVASPPRPRPSPVPSGPRPDPSGLAIPDYDTLSASQVVPRLESLSADELEAVRSYEQATRGRKTILSRVAQLQTS